MPKQAFDVFAPKSRAERFYAQLHRLRRRRNVPVKGASAKPEKQPLTSYMIDPKYLSATTRERPPIHHYSQFAEAGGTATSEVGREALGVGGSIRNYLYRVTDTIRSASSQLRSKPKSAVTYSLSKGVVRDKRRRLARLATVMTLGAAVLLAFGVLSMSGRDTGNSKTETAGVPLLQHNPSQVNTINTGESDPNAVTSATPSAGSGQVRSSTTQTKPSSSRTNNTGSTSTGGTNGGGQGSLTDPVDNMLPCLTSVPSCLLP